MTVDQCLDDLRKQFSILDVVWCDQWKSNIENSNQKFDSVDFWHKIQQLDKVHNTDMTHCFPELSFLQHDKQSI